MFAQTTMVFSFPVLAGICRGVDEADEDALDEFNRNDTDGGVTIVSRSCCWGHMDHFSPNLTLQQIELLEQP
jgi:hypothetical protein